MVARWLALCAVALLAHTTDNTTTDTVHPSRRRLAIDLSLYGAHTAPGRDAALALDEAMGHIRRCLAHDPDDYQLLFFGVSPQAIPTTSSCPGRSLTDCL